MGRKRIIKLPKTAMIKCPNCDKKSRINVPIDSLLNYFDCKKCKQKIETPIMKCCIICAFSNKKCSQSLIMEAKGLRIKY